MLPLSNAEIGQVISELLNASSPEEACCLLRVYPWLMSESIHLKLTQVIANKYRRRELSDVAVFMACRGFLDRCRLRGVDAALATQPGWPLAARSPMIQLLALDQSAPAGQVIERANAALGDADLRSEPDIYGWIHFSLGLGYQEKANRGSKTALIQAIDHFKTAVQAWQEERLVFGQKFMGWARHNLGRLYLERRDGNRSQNIETALQWLTLAWKMSGEGSIDLMDVSILMGKAHIARVQGERLENIEHAINYYQKAHAIAEKKQITKRLGEIEHSLAVAYRVRLLGRRADNYEQAKEWAERALTRFDREVAPTDWARTRAEMATIYAHRRKGDRNANLEEAIKYAEETLEVYNPNTYLRQWTLVQLHLGNLYCDRISGAQSTNLQRATQCFQAVLDKHNQEIDPVFWAEAMNNLGTVYASRSTRPFDTEYLKASECFSQALGVCSPEILSDQARMIGNNWGNLAFRFSQWSEAWDTFQIALQAGEILYQVSSTEAGRRVELAESAGLAARAAYCLLQLNQPDKALPQLEHSKTRMLVEALALGDADLTGLPIAQRETMLNARIRVRELEAEMRLSPETVPRRRYLDQSARLRRSREELRELITTIRAEHPDFMPLGLDLPHILALIPQNGALVAPLITLQGCAVFVLPYGTQTIEAEHILWLDSFTRGIFLELLLGQATGSELGGWMGAYLAHRTHKTRSSLEKWKAALKAFTGQLWDALMGPIHKRLMKLGLAKGAPITLTPQGGLGLLPLHAAWREVKGTQRAFLDDYTVTYTPSTYALSTSHRRLQDERRHRPSLLAVINPTADRNLPFTPVEGEAVAALFPVAARRVLVESEATQETVIQATPGHAYLHFSCHGLYDWENVMRSGLLLADGSDGTLFTLAEIISKLDLSAARLVTLSACETGLTEFRQSPDEYIGLPTGFLQAGAPAVVSTLWSVSDLSTALLMERFYVNHLCGDPDQDLGIRSPLRPSEALRRAQIWLRDKVTVQHLRDYLVRATNSGHIKEYQAREYRREYDDLADDARPFSSPYYWAAFAFYGA